MNGAKINPSPKTRFQESPDNISKHRALVETRELQRGIDFALAEYSAQLSSVVSQEPNQAAVAGLKLTGAQEFLMTFRLPAEMPMRPTHVPAQNLDHKA